MSNQKPFSEQARLEDEIRRDRAALAENLQVLEDRARRAVARVQLVRHPRWLIGLALLGAAALARQVVGALRARMEDPPPPTGRALSAEPPHPR